MLPAERELKAEDTGLRPLQAAEIGEQRAGASVGGGGRGGGAVVACASASAGPRVEAEVLLGCSLICCSCVIQVLTDSSAGDMLLRVAPKAALPTRRAALFWSCASCTSEPRSGLGSPHTDRGPNMTASLSHTLRQSTLGVGEGSGSLAALQPTPQGTRGDVGDGSGASLAGAALGGQKPGRLHNMHVVPPPFGSRCWLLLLALWLHNSLPTSELRILETKRYDAFKLNQFPNDV